MEKIWFDNYLPDTRRNIQYPQTPVIDFLLNSARQYPDNLAIIFMDQKITYRELDLMTSRFARFLQDKGVRKDHRVAVMAPNCPQNVIAFFGALKAGAVVVQHNPMYVEREIEHQLNDSGSETIVCLADLYPKVKNVRARTPLKHVVTFNLDGSPASAGEETTDLGYILKN
jgi:long-chain acyl-CoA synthetase